MNDLSNELLHNSIILDMFGHTEARIGYYQGQDSNRHFDRISGRISPIQREPFALGSDHPSNQGHSYGRSPLFRTKRL